MIGNYMKETVGRDQQFHNISMHFVVKIKPKSNSFASWFPIKKLPLTHKYAFVNNFLNCINT